MSDKAKEDNVNWHELDDTESDDDSEVSSESDGGKSDKEEEEKGDHRKHHGHHHGHHHHKDRNRNYNNDRGGYNKGYNNYNKRNPNSNYEKYYKNDPDFFVRVIKQVEAPHELCVKITKDRGNHKEYSQDDFSKILAGFGVENPDISFTKYGDLRATIEIDDSDQWVKIYSDLFDNLFKKVVGYVARVFYQRDIQELEAIADEETNQYFKQNNEEIKRGKDRKFKYFSNKSALSRSYNFYSDNYKQNKGYQNKNYREQRDYKNRRDYRDQKDYKKQNWNADNKKERNNPKEEEIDPSKSLSGFGTGSGPKMFFNNKKADIDSGSLKDINKSNPIAEEKKEEPIEKEKEETKETKEDTIEVKKEKEPKELELKKRNTDNEFEVGMLHSKPAKKDSDTLENKADVKLKDEEYKQKSQKPVIRPRHSVRGKKATRRPYQNRFQALIESHLDLDESNSPEKGKEEEKSKPTLIGDRPETEKYHKQVQDKDFSSNQESFGRSAR